MDGLELVFRYGFHQSIQLFIVEDTFGSVCYLGWYDLTCGIGRICRPIRSGKGGALEAGDTKTYAGKRTILLPSSTAQLLRDRKESALTESAWRCMSPVTWA